MKWYEILFVGVAFAITLDVLSVNAQNASNPIDTINYVMNAQTNTLMKNTYHTETVTNANAELAADTAQLNALESGNPNNTAVINAAEANYNAQIQVLESVGAVLPTPPVVTQQPAINAQVNAT